MMIIHDNGNDHEIWFDDDHDEKMLPKRQSQGTINLFVGQKTQFWPTTLMKTFAKWKIMEKLICPFSPLANSYCLPPIC